MNTEELEAFRKEFHALAPILEVLASKTRQEILIQLSYVYPEGLRIKDLKVQKCITRPTLSHHIKLLLDAHLIGCKKAATKNYYHLSIKKHMFDDFNTLFHRLYTFCEEEEDATSD